MGYHLRLIDLLAKLYRKQLAEVKVTVGTLSLRHLLAAVTPFTAELRHRHSFSRLIPARSPPSSSGVVSGTTVRALVLGRFSPKKN